MNVGCNNPLSINKANHDELIQELWTVNVERPRAKSEPVQLPSTCVVNKCMVQQCRATSVNLSDGLSTRP
jgi:hypothetical protein